MRDYRQAKTKTKYTLTVALFTLVLGAAPSALAQEVVGGLTPSERPASAPRITAFTHDQVWYQRALTGVSEPYPRSLLFLDNQGGWYTPFDRPGMPGPYDIRRWHGTAP